MAVREGSSCTVAPAASGAAVSYFNSCSVAQLDTAQDSSIAFAVCLLNPKPLCPKTMAEQGVAQCITRDTADHMQASLGLGLFRRGTRLMCTAAQRQLLQDPKLNLKP